MANLSAWLASYSGPILVGLIVLVFLLTVGLLWNAISLRRLQRHYQMLLSGVGIGNLEVLLESQLRQVEQLGGHVRDMEERLSVLDASSRSHLQRLALIRFNPFRDTGGDLSFAVALADDAGDGAVISSLHNRDATRVYAKPLTAWKSTYPLTDEEVQAIGRARGDGKR